MFNNAFLNALKMDARGYISIKLDAQQRVNCSCFEKI